MEAENFYRPSSRSVYERHVSESAGNAITEIPADGKWIRDDVTLTDISHFGGWAEARAVHFTDGGTFDQIYEG